MDVDEVYQDRLHPEPADSHTWLFERLRSLPAIAPAPPGLGAALRKRPPAASPEPPPAVLGFDLRSKATPETAPLRHPIFDTVEALGPAVARYPALTARPRQTSADDEAFSSQTVLMRYPAPVAIAYRRFCQEQAATDRLLKLFSCVEAVTRYLVTLGVCDLFQFLAASGRPDAALPDHKAFRFLKRPQNMQLGM
jgi:hypothetical protein